MGDTLSESWRFRTFSIVDDFNREVLHIEIDTSITSARLVRVFERIKREKGLPSVLRAGNGSELLGETFTSWANRQGIAIQYIQPGKPGQNAYIDQLTRTYCEELLDQYLFAQLEDVCGGTWRWIREYNEQRPHDALGGRTPAKVRQQVVGNSTYKLST